MRLSTVKELAHDLNVHPTTVRGWCRDGAIPFSRIPGRNGGEYRFDIEAVRTAIAVNCFAYHKRAGDQNESDEDRKHVMAVAQRACDEVH